MDLCIKTRLPGGKSHRYYVSILVLMDLCIKTSKSAMRCVHDGCFNPCFNGSMYKNTLQGKAYYINPGGFNPCFNGSMYKNAMAKLKGNKNDKVSILVLMDLCIKTELNIMHGAIITTFQSLF